MTGGCRAGQEKRRANGWEKEQQTEGKGSIKEDKASHQGRQGQNGTYGRQELKLSGRRVTGRGDKEGQKEA